MNTGPVGPTQGEYEVACPAARVFCAVCMRDAATGKERCAQCLDSANYEPNKMTGLCEPKVRVEC